MDRNRLIEKKKYTYEQLLSLIEEKQTLYLEHLIDTNIEDSYFTVFFNHSLVIKDVEQLMFMTYDKQYIHGIIDVYDRIQREKLYNLDNLQMMENDHIADIIIRSDIVINVMKLDLFNFILRGPNDRATLHNKFLIEIYTDWHTQLHFKDNLFFKYFYA